MTTIALDRPISDDTLGHPKGLWVLAGTEIWDRVSFYGMQALLVLYMVGALLLPGRIEHIAGFSVFRRAIEAVTGPLSVQALATQIFGLYIGMVTLTPLLGGILGDRWLGRRRAIVIGALLMTAGHFCMAFDQSFLAALALIVLGCGFLRGNVAPQIGDLYDREDRRRDTAFQIYGAVINFGAFIAPIITGALGAAWGWHVGFGFAGFGMLIGLVVYLSGQRLLPPERPRGPRAPRAALSAGDGRIIGFLLVLAPVVALFWVAQSQVWNTYNLWARDHVELNLGGFQVPVPWLQSLDGLAPFLLVPPVLALWRFQSKHGREPDEFAKCAIGCFIFAGATLILAASQFVVDGAGRTPIFMAVLFHLTSNLGWVYFAPTVTALYSRLAPARVNATLIAVSQIAVTLGSLTSGRLGALYERLPVSEFWALHAASAALGGVLMLAFGLYVRRRARSLA
ncbi:MAG TPA: peptide MFS transporter [Caulobacteraceae bacterium]|jgi:POT family proton-dependent oligopeptide transporter